MIWHLTISFPWLDWLLKKRKKKIDDKTITYPKSNPTGLPTGGD